MVGGTACSRSSDSLSAKHLSKIWKMSEKSAEKTINITIQRCVRTEEPTMCENAIVLINFVLVNYVFIIEVLWLFL